MLRYRMMLPGMAARVVCQVGASVAATLIASAIFAALPRATVPADRPAVELTSGGKFAARIPGAEADDAQTTVERRPVLPVLAEAPSQPVVLTALDSGWDDAVRPAAVPSPEKPARLRSRLPSRNDARRLAEGGEAEAKRSSDQLVAGLGAKPIVPTASETSAPKADDGLLPRVESSVRSLWSMTSSAGGSLLSRVLP